MASAKSRRGKRLGKRRTPHVAAERGERPTLEAIIAGLKALAPETGIFVPAPTAKILPSTRCLLEKPRPGGARSADGETSAPGPEWRFFLTVERLEELLIDLSLKKTHFGTPDLIAALNHYARHGTFLQIPQPY